MTETKRRTKEEKRRHTAAEDSRKAATSYAKELKRVELRERERKIFVGMQDMVFGRDTEEARMVAEIVEVVQRIRGGAKQKAKPVVKLTPKQRRAIRKEKDSRVVELVTPKGVRVRIDKSKNPLAGMYKEGAISSGQFAAGQRFLDDSEAADYAGMRSRGFEPGVDGGGAAMANLSAIQAQRTLKDLRLAIGEEEFLLMTAVILRNYSISQIHEFSSKMPDNKTEGKAVISSKLKHALARTATFYSLQDPQASRTLRTLQLLLRDMAAEVGEHTL